MKLHPSVNKPAYPGIANFFVLDDDGKHLPLESIPLSERVELTDKLINIFNLNFQWKENHTGNAYITFYEQEAI